GDRFGARYGDLEDAGAEVPSGAAERLLDGLRVKARAARRRRGRYRAAERRAARGQGLTERPRHLDGVAVSLVVHVHHVGRHFVQVVVDGGDLEPSTEEA